MKYVFLVHLKPRHTAEEYAGAWMRASEIIQRAYGAQGTRLHRKVDDPNTLLAIARWDSKTSRDAMEGQPDPRVTAILTEAREYCDITLLGEFEEPEWVVLPSTR